MNESIEKYNNIVNSIANKYNYPSNISHLLSIIIYAFVEKYGRDKENLIINTFSNIPIIISKKIDKNILAYYISNPIRKDNKIITQKCVVLNNYEGISLIKLLDNLVHEYNHAVNSYNNEITIENNNIKIRTGISNIIYDNNLNFVSKDKSAILEEILNTSDTTDIINIIKNIDYKNIKDISIQNTLYSINGETGNKYLSNSYFLEVYICKYLLNNKTFVSTLNALRISGNINEIDKWFDDIVGIKDSYQNLIDYIDQIFKLEYEIDKKTIKLFTINKIKKLNNKIINLINIFNNNLNYK